MTSLQKHRRILYQNDWLPMKTGLAFVFLSFGLFLVFLPRLADNATVLRWFCYVASVRPFGSFLGFFILGVRDRNLIVEVLASLKQEPSNDRS